jgi:hypothetical protein
LVRAVVVGVVLIGLFVFFFVTPAHDPKPNGLPVVVVGPPAATDPLTLSMKEGWLSRGGWRWRCSGSAGESGGSSGAHLSIASSVG